MLKVYRNTAIFMVFVIMGIQWGFHAVYTSEFPNFKGNTSVDHIHGALMMTWMLLLIIQPLLIGSGRAALHRTIGKLSYLLGPLIILFIFLMTKEGYWRDLRKNEPMNVVLAISVLNIRGLFAFAIFWSLAMLYRKDPPAHMRYMIGTGILGIGPGTGRGLISGFDLSLWDAMTITDLVGLAIAGFLLAHDLYRKKNPKPFLVVWCVLAAGVLAWQARDSAAWQGFASWFARMFF